METEEERGGGERDLAEEAEARRKGKVTEVVKGWSGGGRKGGSEGREGG